MRDFSAVPPHGLFIKTQVARAHFAADKGIADDRIPDNLNGIADDDRRANDGGAGTGCAALSADRRVLLSCAVVPCMLQGWREQPNRYAYPCPIHRCRLFDAPVSPHPVGRSFLVVCASYHACMHAY